jgi:hypothetical protein
MATKKGKGAAGKKSAKKKTSEQAVMWVRLPRPMDVKALKKLGVQGAGCFGGDTCIAATSMQTDAGIVLQADLEAALAKAKLTRRADPCFGGDTCIV